MGGESPLFLPSPLLDTLDKFTCWCCRSWRLTFDRLSYQGRGKPYMWLFIHMAMGIAGDLGLDRPAAARGVRVISMAGRAQSQPVKVQTLEETRALLGCYIICSA